jgi:hypothetical protein
MEPCTCIKFCAKLEKTGAETYEMVKIAFQEKAVSCTQVFEWYRCLKDGHPSVNL